MGMNPAIADLTPLIGRWRMELYGAAFLPDPGARVTGSIGIDWLEEGAAIVMRQGDAEHPSAAVWIISLTSFFTPASSLRKKRRIGRAIF